MQQQRTLWLSTLLLAAVALVLASCDAQVRGSGTIVEEDRPASDMEAMDVSSFIQVFITQGSTPSIRVEADDNLIEDIRTEVKSHRLMIYYEGSGWVRDYTANVYVTMPALTDLDISGSSDVVFEGDFDLSDLEIETSGSSDLKVNGRLEADNLRVRVHGSSDVVMNRVTAAMIDVETHGSSDAQMEGDAERLDLEAHGSSNFMGKHLTATDVMVRSHGSSDVEVRVTGHLDADASGSSDIGFYGNPNSKNIHTSGSADIHDQG